MGGTSPINRCAIRAYAERHAQTMVSFAMPLFVSQPPCLVKAALSDDAACISGRNFVATSREQICVLNLRLESDQFGPGICMAVQVKGVQSTFRSNCPKFEASSEL